MNSMPWSRLSRKYEVVYRPEVAGLLGKSCSLSSVVCSWHTCSVGRLEQASILSCDVCSALRMKISDFSYVSMEENVPQATEVR